MYLESIRYDEIEKEVIKLYKKVHIDIFPIDCFDLCKQLGIEVVPYSSKSKKALNQIGDASKDGFSVLFQYSDGSLKWKIYYNDSMPKERIWFTIMHEIGHVRLDHTEHSELAEAEANYFAKYSLAPPPLIHQLYIEDFVDLAEKFGISLTCAYYAMQSYAKWLRYGPREYQAHELVLVSLHTMAPLINLIKLTEPLQSLQNAE